MRLIDPKQTYIRYDSNLFDPNHEENVKVMEYMGFGLTDAIVGGNCFRREITLYPRYGITDEYILVLYTTQDAIHSDLTCPTDKDKGAGLDMSGYFSKQFRGYGTEYNALELCIDIFRAVMGVEKFLGLVAVDAYPSDWQEYGVNLVYLTRNLNMDCPYERGFMTRLCKLEKQWRQS